MKVILAIVSLILTAAAVVLTGQVMKPPAPIKNSESRPDPEPQLSERTPNPAGISAEVADSDIERFYRQNLFHPDREWVDPDLAIAQATDTDAGDKTEEEPEPSEAENFELMGVLRVGDRATAVIKILPPKPKPVVRSRSRGIPSRVVRKPSPPKAPEKKEKDTKVYALGKPIGETGYTLAKVDLESVELKRDSDSSVITLNLDKMDEGSAARRKGAQTAAATKAKAVQAKVDAARKAAATPAPPKANPKAPNAKPKATPAKLPPTPAAPATTAAQSAEERAQRLEKIRDQFRKRLEERRKNGTTK